MGNLPETSRWVDEIYRLQTTDPVSGGADGTLNIQPSQITDRTLYLKNTLEKEHTPEGEHKLTDAAFANNAAIPESMLALNYSTSELNNRYLVAKAAMDVLRREVEDAIGESGFFIEGLAKVVLLNWKYGDFGYDFEFFSDGLTMRDMKNSDARRAIAKDDSVDCTDTSSMRPDMRLLLFDANNSEEVEIMSVLERGRIRLKKDITKRFTDDAYIGYTNIDLSVPGKAVFTKGKYYYTRPSTTIGNLPYGILMICRNKSGGKLKVEYRDIYSLNPDTWEVADLENVLPYDNDDTKVYEQYTVSGANVQLKISGDNVTVYHMALFPNVFTLLESSIRRPSVVVPYKNMEMWQDTLLFESSAFYAAYHDYYAQTEYGIFNADTDEQVYSTTSRIRTLIEVTGSSVVPPTGNYVVKCRHQSDVAEWSQWSKPVPITIHATRLLFGFKYMNNNGGFNSNAIFNSVKFYPIRFGFEGALLSRGFDRAEFCVS